MNAAALAPLFLLLLEIAQPQAQEAQYAELRREAEKLHAEGSYALARELYVKADALELPALEALWVDFRLADTGWRSQAATQQTDNTRIEEARSQLEALNRALAERERQGEPRGRLWAGPLQIEQAEERRGDRDARGEAQRRARGDALRQERLRPAVLAHDRREVPEVVEQHDDARVVAEPPVGLEAFLEVLERAGVVARLGVEHADVVGETRAEVDEVAGGGDREPLAEQLARFGEPHFRDGERRVIARLLTGKPMVLATGGGAFINGETRALILRDSLCIWLDADIQTLVERVGRRGHRPLLKDRDPGEVLRELAAVRNPIYAEAHLRVSSASTPHDHTVRAILEALATWKS